MSNATLGRSHGLYDNPKSKILVQILNELLNELYIPITLETPFDLTPSLLLAILESIIRERLPIPKSTRDARDLPSKVQMMKIFLGVLEGDVLGEDIGLSDIDPRRLATGEWDEVVFVGEVLCWLGKIRHIIPDIDITRPAQKFIKGEGSLASLKQSNWYSEDSFDRELRRRARSPSTHSTVTTRNSMNTTLSMMRSAPAAGSDTTVLSVAPEESFSLSDLDLFENTSKIGQFRTSTPPPTSPPTRTRTPRCIHEVEDPSFVHDCLAALDLTCNESQAPEDTVHLYRYEPTPLPRSAAHSVRHTGWIEPVDDDEEVRSFEAMRQPTRTLPPTSDAVGTSSAKTPPIVRVPNRIYTKHNSPTQYTLALLNERAKLLEELANIKATSSWAGK